ESALSPVYLTSVETEKQLSAIKGEISGLISQTANESGIAVVMDTTLSMRPIKKAENLYAIPSYPDPADNLSPSLFQLFSNWEIPQGIQLNGPDGRPIDAAKHMAPVIAANMAQNLKRYLEFQPYLTQTAAAFTPGQIFLVGGYDLTPQIAGKIFSKYRIPTEIQNSFIGLIRDYCSFERAKYSR
ncbi:hypothetical protein HYY75_00235, partial [bacterium]|nr:hypothetical protein [bacterium]